MKEKRTWEIWKITLEKQSENRSKENVSKKNVKKRITDIEKLLAYWLDNSHFMQGVIRKSRIITNTIQKLQHDKIPKMITPDKALDIMKNSDDFKRYTLIEGAAHLHCMGSQVSSAELDRIISSRSLNDANIIVRAIERRRMLHNNAREFPEYMTFTKAIEAIGYGVIHEHYLECMTATLLYLSGTIDLWKEFGDRILECP